MYNFFLFNKKRTKYNHKSLDVKEADFYSFSEIAERDLLLRNVNVCVYNNNNKENGNIRGN